MSSPLPDPPRRRPTIADVARRAGVSAAAVSFAVNDRPGVSRGTRERILAVARELGWQPSASARALTQARTRAVGLVLSRSEAELEGDPFFVRFLSGLERVLTAADHALLLQIVPGDAAAALPAYQRLAGAGRVDALLLIDVETEDPRLAPLAAAALPVVLAGRPFRDTPFAWVETRHAEGVAPAVAHLSGLGHDRIGFFSGDAGSGHQRARRDAWRGAVERAGLAPGPVAAVVDDELATALALLREGPSAVVCTSDALALAVYGAARELGLRVPHDLSVTGFDDSAPAGVVTPALTSVRVDYGEFGEAAARALLAVIAGQAPPAYEPSPPELVVRDSTALRRRR